MDHQQNLDDGATDVVTNVSESLLFELLTHQRKRVMRLSIHRRRLFGWTTDERHQKCLVDEVIDERHRKNSMVCTSVVAAISQTIIMTISASVINVEKNVQF